MDSETGGTRCPRCSDLYIRPTDYIFIRVVGTCIHCVAETSDNADQFASVVKSVKYPIIKVEKFYLLANKDND
jgi:hypothetical protein